MSRIFNISFTYSNRVYNALLTLNGSGEITLRISNDTIEILLPHGRLTVPINIVVNYFTPGLPGNTVKKPCL